MNKFFRILLVLSALAIALTCAGCASKQDGVFPLKMTATLIDPDAYKNPSATLTIRGTEPEAGTEGEILNHPIEISMELGDGIDYSFGTAQSPYLYSVLPSSGTGEILHITASIYDPETNAPISGMIGLDLENECCIYIFDDDSGRYIVASTDGSATPESILEHFAAFIAFYEK